MPRTTLMFLRRKGEILLAMKKRRYGAGRWNGAGGKAEPGETPLEAALRECQEEINVTPVTPELVGRLSFYDQAVPDSGHDCYIYTAYNWTGGPSETEEMRPQWFAEAAIPYDQMWPDDRLWLPLLLRGQYFVGDFTVNDQTVLDYHLQAVAELPGPDGHDRRDLLH